MGDIFAPSKPATQPPARMPDREDPAVKEAERRRTLEAMQRGGRQGTFLSGGGQATGDTYAADKMGAGR